ncbi:MAG: hypothetical protein ACR2H6_10445 [Pyrinomonadaceae bacterium]
MQAITFKNIFLSLFLSLALTLILAVLYAVYPLMSVILGSIWEAIVTTGPQTSGIGAVAGGVSAVFPRSLLIFALVVFLINFAFLQKRIQKN